MPVYITVDTSDAMREVDRLSRVPSERGIQELETVLKFGYDMTNDATHVITGSLKGSEKMLSEEAHKKWEGTLIWGGATTGPKNPVDYAIYEKARGEDHDFTLSAKINLPPLWVDAVKEALKS